MYYKLFAHNIPVKGKFKVLFIISKSLNYTLFLIAFRSRKPKDSDSTGN